MKKYVFIVCAMIWAAATLQARKGYEKSFHLDGRAGMGEIRQTYNVGITMTNGYRFNGHFLLGANVGIAFSEYVCGLEQKTLYYVTRSTWSERGLLIPLSAVGKYNFTESVISPYMSTRLGYTFNVKSTAEKSYGAFFMPALGFDMHAPGWSVSMQLIFDMQRTSYIKYSDAVSRPSTDGGASRPSKADEDASPGLQTGTWTKGWFKSWGLGVGISF